MDATLKQYQKIGYLLAERNLRWRGKVESNHRLKVWEAISIIKYFEDEVMLPQEEEKAKAYIEKFLEEDVDFSQALEADMLDALATQGYAVLADIKQNFRHLFDDTLRENNIFEAKVYAYDKQFQEDHPHLIRIRGIGKAESKKYGIPKVPNKVVYILPKVKK